MIHVGPYPALDVPDVRLDAWVLRKVQALGSKPAFVCGVTGRALSYGEFGAAVERTAAGLVRHGLAKGDVFAVSTANCLEYPIAFHAVARAGGILTPINPTGTAHEIHEQLTDSGARFLLTSPEIASRSVEAARGTSVEDVFSTASDTDLVPFEALSRGSAGARFPAIDPRVDVVALPYSSGTTGLPKGVMLTHRNLVANVVQLDVGHQREDDVLVCVLPMFHIYGITAIMNSALAIGSTTVVMPRFDLARLVDVIVRRRVTFAHLVPPILIEIAKNPLFARVDLAHLRVVFSGAAPLSPELSRAVADRVGCGIVQGYGMTEASPATHMTPKAPHASKHGSVGLPLAGTECRIVDPATGIDLTSGDAGEIWIRGPQVMKGYLNRPDATRATVDDDGWLHTGDIGLADGDGHVFVVDRVKELIKYKAWQVAPAELEALLLTHPAVADVAVVGVADPETGEVPKAFVVRKGDVSAADIEAFVAERVAPYKKVRVVEFVERIPKSPSGKILRRMLRDRP